MEYYIARIDKNDITELLKYSTLLNDNVGRGSWKMNPMRLKQRLGTRGDLWGLYEKYTSSLIGGIALKEHKTDDVYMGEVGYLFVLPEHRSMRNVIMLYQKALKHAKRFDMVYAVSSVNNKPINKLLEASPKVTFAFSAKPLVGTAKLNYWLFEIHNRRLTDDERLETLRREFAQ